MPRSSEARASLSTRIALVALAALGHLAFLGSLLWREGWQLVPWLASANVAVIAWVALLPRRSALGTAQAIWRVVIATAVMGAVTYTVLEHDAGVLSPGGLVVVAVWGFVCGLMASTVAVPLSLALDRRRREPTVERALDAWTTLACVAAVLALIAPVGMPDAHECATDSFRSSCRHLPLAHAVFALDGAIGAFTLILAAALWTIERVGSSRRPRPGRCRASGSTTRGAPTTSRARPASRWAGCHGGSRWCATSGGRATATTPWTASWWRGFRRARRCRGGSPRSRWSRPSAPSERFCDSSAEGPGEVQLLVALTTVTLA